MADTLGFETHGRIALLTLNRPNKLNALNYELVDAIVHELDNIEEDARVGAVVLTGSGSRAFSAGADITEFSESLRHGPDKATKAFVTRGQAMTKKIEAFPKPIIAAVNGLAFGGGCEITEAAHLAIASENAIFAKPEVAIGIPPTFGGTQRLPRLAGRKRALEHLLTGDPFGPSRALEIGLVNAIVPAERLLASAFEMAERILRHPAAAVACIISAVTRGIDVTIEEGLRIERDQFARMAATSETREAIDLWLGRSRSRLTT